MQQDGICRAFRPHVGWPTTQVEGCELCTKLTRELDHGIAMPVAGLIMYVVVPGPASAMRDFQTMYGTSIAIQSAQAGACSRIAKRGHSDVLRATQKCGPQQRRGQTPLTKDHFNVNTDTGQHVGPKGTASGSVRSLRSVTQWRGVPAISTVGTRRTPVGRPGGRERESTPATRSDVNARHVV
eukprot:jgi/Ulvmu1/9898/UM057_0055.1